MPLTFSHPAAIVPLRRVTWLSVTGLAVGSMAPDFEYYLRMRTAYNLGHLPSGWVLVDVPAGLVVAWLFHRWLRDPLIENLPGRLRRRLAPWHGRPWDDLRARPLAMAASVLVGVLTHIAWDAVTHPFMPTAQALGLDRRSPLLGLPWATLLQHLSTGLGLVVLATLLLRLPESGPEPSERPDRWFWPLVLGSATGVLALRVALGADWQDISTVVVTLASGAFLGWAAAAARVRLRQSRPIEGPGGDRVSRHARGLPGDHAGVTDRS